MELEDRRDALMLLARILQATANDTEGELDDYEPPSVTLGRFFHEKPEPRFKPKSEREREIHEFLSKIGGG